MSDTRILIAESETAQYRDWMCLRTYPDGAVTRWIEREWKDGTAQRNREELLAKATTARDYFRGRYTDWAQLTNADKDLAMRQAMRALANLCALAANVLDDPGV
jgi:hypothetical protein